MNRRYANVQERLLADTLTYGSFSWRENGKVRSEGAHRVSLRAFRGVTPPKGGVVRHGCNHSLCINPMHLAGGTYAENTADVIEAGHHYTPFKRALT